MRRCGYPPEVVEKARAMYVDEGQAPAAIAEVLGAPFTPKKVRYLAYGLGWSQARPAEVKRQIKLAQLAMATPAALEGRRRAAQAKREALGVVRAPAKPAALGSGRGVSTDVRALIDAAIAEGKVTVLPTGNASGLSAAEGQFWAAGLAGGWREPLRGSL